MGHYEPKHAKPAPPFPETVKFKTIAAGAAITISAGIAATGGGVATNYSSPHQTPPSAAYGVATNTYADPYPYHSDPSGEWVRVETLDQGGTASIFHTIVIPSGG